jgi:hypothetical protein
MESENVMNVIPAHKSGTAGQIVNPPSVNHDMMDDMGKYAEQEKYAPGFSPAKAYKPAHGGYPDGNKPSSTGY